MKLSSRAISRAISAIDPACTLRGVQWLSARVARLRVAQDGSETALYLLTHSRGDRLRNPNIGRDEFRTLRALQPTSLPVAAPMHLDESHEPPFLITAALPGRVRSGARRDPDFCVKLADMLARIHAQSPRAHDLGFLPRAEERLDEMIGGGGDADPIVAALQGARARIRHNPPALLHGDFWLGNLLWRGGEISGIVDWEDAMLGDPLADLGKSRLEMLWSLGQAEMAAYTARYLRLNRGLDAGALPFWDLWGAARLRHFGSFARDEAARGKMRAQFDRFVAAAIHALQV